MPHLIIATHNQGVEELRESLRPEHRQHLASAGKKLLAAGALLTRNGAITGGMCILDTENFDEAVLFGENDPYNLKGVCFSTAVTPWRRRWWDGEFKDEIRAG